MVVAFLIATLAGVYLVHVAGPWIAAAGALSIASGIAYTAGPLPLAYVGLGDVFVLFFFGFVAVSGTAFVQTGSVSFLAVLSSVPVGCLATAILVVNNVRDRESDRGAGKRTLAVRLGRRAAIAEYVLLLAMSYVVPVVLVASSEATPLILLPLVTAPLAFRLVKEMRAGEGFLLNRTLGRTAMLLFAFGVLFSIGIACGAVS
jgi:1,4-dihydroxy-2-naphthoate octaprenyltransferase